MRAITFHGVESVRCEAVRDPRIEAPGDALVRVELAGICGSDLHVYHGRERGLDLGTVLGHELVGRVVEVGADVRGLRVGQRVASPFTTSCGACFYCARGLSCRCPRGALFGWVREGVGLQGAQAELVRVPLADATLVGVPEGIGVEEALLLGDVLPTGWHCAERAGLEAGGLAAVIGCGPVGLMAVVALGELGAGRILALDTVPERLALARRFGAEPVDASETDALAHVRRESDGRGADAVLEAVGSASAARLAFDLVRPGGTISAVGVPTDARFAFSPIEAYDRNVTFRIGRCPARYLMDRLLPFVLATRHELASVFSHRLPLEEGPRGFEIFARKLDACTKVALVP